MNSPLRQTQTHLKSLLRQHGLQPRGDLGQNFLIDLNLLESLVTQADLCSNDVVLEVGTGTGGLTSFLADRAGAVVTVEYDSNMHRLASSLLESRSNITLVNCDALKNKNELNPIVMEAVRSRLKENENRTLKLVANLPYHVGTPVIANVMASDLPWSRMVVTIQYELAQRLMATPSTPDYGALSVFVQAQCRVTILHKLGPTVFWPPPKVDSAIVQIDPDDERRLRIHDRSFFQVFLRSVFTQRRKVLCGVVAHVYKPRLSRTQIDEVVRELGIPSEIRAEALSVEQLVSLSNRLSLLHESR